MGIVGASARLLSSAVESGGAWWHGRRCARPGRAYRSAERVPAEPGTDRGVPGRGRAAVDPELRLEGPTGLRRAERIHPRRRGPSGAGAMGVAGTACDPAQLHDLRMADPDP